MPETAGAPTHSTRSAPHAHLVSALTRNPDGILEKIAADHCVSTFDVVNALPTEHASVCAADRFEAIMTDVATWGEVMMIVHTPNIVMECKGAIPPGSFGRGYFNIHGDSPIGGHIKAERCRHIAFVSRPFMGRASCSIQFFDNDGDAMFKIFVGRDAERNLRVDQVDRFNELRQRECG